MKVSCKDSVYTFTDGLIQWCDRGSGQCLEWMRWTDPEGGETKYAQKFHSRGPSPHTSSSRAYMELSSLRLQDMAMHYCARDTVWGHLCEPKHKLPCGRTHEQQDAIQSSSHYFYHMESPHSPLFSYHNSEPEPGNNPEGKNCLTCSWASGQFQTE